MFYIVFDFGMLVIFIALEVYFYQSQGKRFHVGIGCLMACGIWALLFVLLLVERTREEKRDEK